MGFPYGNLSANSKNIKNFQLQQKFKGVLLVFIIGVPLALGIVAYSAYRNYINPTNQLAETRLDDPGFPQGTEIDQTAGVIDPNAPVDNSQATNSSNAPAASPAPRTIPSGPPEGVITAINSVEANGIKNNPYVAIDTSGIPDGTVIRVDRSTWTTFGNDQGVASGTITAYGQTRNGSLTFSLIDGTWRIVSYSVDS